MNHKTFIGLIFCLALITVGCSKDSSQDQDLAQGSDLNELKKATQGATQLSGIGVLAPEGLCAKALDEEPAYAVNMTGDLVGCLYTFIDDFECSPSGTYREIGRELFVGTYKGGESGSFWTTYKFEAKYEGCEDGNIVGAEIKGRCQHPIVEGSGTGVFEGVSGRLDMKDDIQASGITYPYRGHLNGLN